MATITLRALWARLAVDQSAAQSSSIAIRVPGAPGSPGTDGAPGPNIITLTTAVNSIPALFLLRVASDGTHVDQLDPSTFAPATHTHPASAIDSGTLADSRLSSNVTLNNAANTFTSTQTFNAASGSQIVAKSVASQTTNLQEWQNSSGIPHLFVSPNKLLSTYDNYYLSIKPGTREYQIGTYDAGGRFLFARSDSSNAIQFTPNPADVRLNCTYGDMRITGSPWGKLYLAGNESGGAVNIEMGCRYSDSSASVGANVRIWTATGQSVNALSILSPGGSTILGGFNAAGRLAFNATNTSPANTTAIVGWVDVVVNGSTYKMPLYQ